MRRAAARSHAVAGSRAVAALAALTAALLALALLAAPASAERLLLEQADADDLAQQLGEAREATGVCFAWQVQIDAFDGSPSGVDAGSDAGPDQSPSGCRGQLSLVGQVQYTSEASEAEDSAGIDVVADGVPAGTVGELEQLAGQEAGDLLGDDDDKALFNLVAALPLLAAQADPQLAARLPELERGGAPADARVRGAGGGSDFLRANGAMLGLAVLLGLATAFLLVSGLRRRRAAGRPVTPRPRRT